MTWHEWILWALWVATLTYVELQRRKANRSRPKRRKASLLDLSLIRDDLLTEEQRLQKARTSEDFADREAILKAAVETTRGSVDHYVRVFKSYPTNDNLLDRDSAKRLLARAEDQLKKFYAST